MTQNSTPCLPYFPYDLKKLDREWANKACTSKINPLLAKKITNYDI